MLEAARQPEITKKQISHVAAWIKKELPLEVHQPQVWAPPRRVTKQQDRKVLAAAIVQASKS